MRRKDRGDANAECAFGAVFEGEGESKGIVSGNFEGGFDAEKERFDGGDDMFFLSDPSTTKAGDTDTERRGIVVETKADGGLALCVGADLGVPIEGFAEVGACGGLLVFFVELSGEDTGADKAVVGISDGAVVFSDAEVDALVVGGVMCAVVLVVERL